MRAPHPPAVDILPLSIVDTEARARARFLRLASPLLTHLERNASRPAQLYMIGGPCSGTLFFAEALDGERMRDTLAQALEAFPLLAGRVVSLPPAGVPPAATAAAAFSR